MNKARAACLVIAALGSGTALAQSAYTYNPSWYIAPSVNAMDPDSDFRVDRNGAGLGLRFGKPVSPRWDIQFGVTHARSNNGGSRYEQDTLGFDGLYMFSRERLRPFLLVGYGVERDRVSGTAGSLSRTSPFLEAGVGVQYSFTDQWSAQVDVRRVHGFIDNNSFGVNHADTNYVTVGLVYAFDKPPAPVRVAQRAEPAPVVVAPAPVVIVPPPPPPRPAPPPAPRFERITLSATELFEFDKAVLRMPQPKLDEIAQTLNGNTQIRDVVVTGYTDRIGSDAYNLKLSQRRAAAVRDYLTGKGVASDRLRAEGKGEANPVVTCTDKNRTALIACLAPNRRVEVEQIVIERRVN